MLNATHGRSLARPQAPQAALGLLLHQSRTSRAGTTQLNRQQQQRRRPGLPRPDSSSSSSSIPRATRDVNFAYQQDIQTKLKPGDFAERMDGKGDKLAAAADWQAVLRLFEELGEGTDRNVGLVGDMLVQLQRLVPPAAAAAAAAAAAGAAAATGRLSTQEAATLAEGISGMCGVLLDNITRVNNKLLIDIIWALALLPDPAKTLAPSPAAAAARVRAVAGFGAAAITRMPKLTAEELFHVCAALALLGFRPPRTLTREPQNPGAEDRQNAHPAGSQGGMQQLKFGAFLEKRSVKVMHYLSPKSIADAGFVVSRLVVPGDISREWLDLYQKVSKQHLATMNPEAVVYAGYALARHGFKPSNSWQKAYIAALQDIASSLTGEEFPIVLFTLARWRQQQQQQQGAAAVLDDQEEDYEEEEYSPAGQQWSFGSSNSSSSSGGSSSSSNGLGPAAPQTLIDELLFASHSSRAMRALPLSQIVVMVKALTELQVTVNSMWISRLWPLVNSKIDAGIAAAEAAAKSSSSSSTAAATSLAADLAVLLAAIPRLNPSPSLPDNFLDGLVGNLGLGLEALNPADLAGVWLALQQLKHTPDVIFQRQLQSAVLAAVRPKTPSRDLAVLLQLGLAISLNPSSSSSNRSSSSVQGLLPADAFCQQLLEGVTREVQRRVGLASGHRVLAADGAVLPAAAKMVAQQELRQRQQLLDGSAQDGLWEMPQTLLTCVQHVNAAVATAAAAQGSGGSSGAPAAAAAVAGVLQDCKPQLQRLWLDSAVALAAVMPTEPLLVLLGFVLDMPSEDAAALGLGGSSSSGSGGKEAAAAAILESGVYQHLGSTVPTASGRGRAGVTAGPGTSGYTPAGRRNLLVEFSVADFLEVLVVVGDAGQADKAPEELLDIAAEALHGALAPKGPAYGLECGAGDAEDLVRELAAGFSYDLPSKVKARYKKWCADAGLEPPEELSARRRKSSSGSRKKAAPAVQQPVSARPPAAISAAAAGAAPVQPQVDGSSVVRSSRNRVQ